MHDYSDRNPSYRQSCTALTARNFTALTPGACELVQIKKDPLIFHIFHDLSPLFADKTCMRMQLAAELGKPDC